MICETEAELIAGLQASIEATKPKLSASVQRRYIGSGDIAAVAALYVPEWAHMSKWKNAADVYLRLAHGLDIPMRSNMTRGLEQEGRLRQLYRDTVGPVSDPPPSAIKHPTLAWAAASPDGLAGDDGVVEYKTYSVFQRGQWGEPGTDLVPDNYSLQVQWLLECTGRTWAHYLVSFGRDIPKAAGGGWATEETAVFQVERSPELAARLVEYGQRFIDEHVKARRAPGMEPRHNRRAWRRLVNEAGR